MPAPKSMRQIGIFFDLESSYETGGNPALPARALVAFQQTIPQLRADKRQRQYVQPFFGARPSLLANKTYPMPFMLEAQGSGTAGTAPPIRGPILIGGMTELIKTGTATIDAAYRRVTGTGAFTYTRTAAGTPKVIRKVTLTCTTPGGTGIAAFTVSAPATGAGAAAETAYSQTGVVMTNGQAFALPSGATITPTITTSFAAGDMFTLEIGPSRVEYWPSSDRDNHASGIIHCEADDHRFVLKGSRAGLSFEASTTEFPRFSIEAVGKYTPPAKVTPIGTDWSSFKAPDIVDKANTWLFELHGYAAVMERCSVNHNNEVAQVVRVGREEVRIGDRNVTGNFVFEAPDLATKDYFAGVDARTAGEVRFCHGTTPGKIIDIKGLNVEIDPVQISDGQGDMILTVPATFMAYDTAVGDDEIVYRFY